MHPRSTCSHADQGPSPGGIICRLKIVEDNSHVGCCRTCSSNTNPTAQIIATPPAPIPLADWPAWAKAVRDERELPTDTGVGDTVARRLGDGGIIVQAWAALLGIPCGCAARQAEWNVLYPYAQRLSI